MGVIYSTLVRKAQRFNVENRAFRHIEKNKPKAAPRHPTSAQYYEQFMADTQDVKKELATKDTQLNAYLKDVYVTSTDMMPEFKRDKTLLPQNRLAVEDDELGIWEPSKVSQGFCSLKQALQMIADHQSDPKQWTAAAIAAKYNLAEKKVELILDYYKPFNVYLPAKKPGTKGYFSAQKVLQDARNILQISEKKKKSTEERTDKT